MKKITSLAAALCMATAFCGFCTGCAMQLDDKDQSSSVATSVSTGNAATTAATDERKVILSPGWYYGATGKTENEIEDAGATKLSAADEGVYFVENAYFAEVAAGDELPEPTTTRSGMTFVGWRYAKDGEVVTVNTMPNVTTLSSDLILYAEWFSTGAETPDIPVTEAESITITFSNGAVTFQFATPSWANGAPSIHIWSGSTTLTGEWPGITLDGSSKTLTAATTDISGVIISFMGDDGQRKQTTDIVRTWQVGTTYKVDIGAWSTEDPNKFAPIIATVTE